MPIPYKRYDMKKIIAAVERVRPEEADAMVANARRRGRENLLGWLARYDEHGHLKHEFEGDLEYLYMETYEFLSMTADEQAAYIVSEKKRLGVL